MTIEQVRDLLESLSLQSFSCGCFDFELAAPESLVDFQIGYAVDPAGDSLVGETDGAWEASWVALARDFLCDPIFTDTNLPMLPVFTAVHGAGKWTPRQIAPSFSAFADVMRAALTLARGRESPVALRSNPIGEEERQAFRAIVDTNGASAEYWLGLFEDPGDDD